MSPVARAAVEHRERDVFAVLILYHRVVEAGRVIPYGYFGIFAPVERRRIEKLYRADGSVAALSGGESEMRVLRRQISRAAALGRRFAGIGERYRRGVRHLRYAAHTLIGVNVCRRHSLLKSAEREFTRFDRAGAGEDVVEMVEQNVPPGVIEPARLARRAVCRRHRGKCLRVVEPRFRYAVGGFYARLRRVTAGKQEIALRIVYREIVFAVFEYVEIFPERAEADDRRERPALIFLNALYIAPRRSAAVVADAENA